MNKVIAKIERTSLGWEDHGIFTCWLSLTYGSSGQGAGGYGLDEPVHDEDGRFVGRRGTAYGMEFVARVMRACGVDEWSKVTGRTVYAIKDGDSAGWGGTVIGIAPLETEPGEQFLFSDIAHLAEKDSVAA